MPPLIVKCQLIERRRSKPYYYEYRFDNHPRRIRCHNHSSVAEQEGPGGEDGTGL